MARGDAALAGGLFKSKELGLSALEVVRPLRSLLAETSQFMRGHGLVLARCQDEVAPLLAELHQNLKSAGVVLVDKRENSRAVLIITGEEKGRRVLSVGGAGTVQEYELRYAVTFTVVDHEGKEILPAHTVERLRAVSFNEAQVLAKGSEEELLYRDLRRDVVQGMIRRLSAVDKTVAP